MATNNNRRDQPDQEHFTLCSTAYSPLSELTEHGRQRARMSGTERPLPDDLDALEEHARATALNVRVEVNFRRAVRYSHLAKAVPRKHRDQLYDLTAKALSRLFEICPESVGIIGVEINTQATLLSVRHLDSGRMLHIPARTLTPAAAQITCTKILSAVIPAGEEESVRSLKAT